MYIYIQEKKKAYHSVARDQGNQLQALLVIQKIPFVDHALGAKEAASCVKGHCILFLDTWSKCLDEGEIKWDSTQKSPAGKLLSLGRAVKM